MKTQTITLRDGTPLEIFFTEEIGHTAICGSIVIRRAIAMTNEDLKAASCGLGNKRCLEEALRRWFECGMAGFNGAVATLVEASPNEKIQRRVKETL